MCTFFFRKCLDRYNAALSVVDTDEMWDKYLTTILKITADTKNTEVYKRNLLRQSMFNAHKKNKLKPKHYIEWVRYLNYVFVILCIYFTIFPPLFCLDKQVKKFYDQGNFRFGH